MYTNILTKNLTTFKIGGPVKYFKECETHDDLLSTIAWSLETSIPYLIIGNGSNILISDSGFEGLIIKLCGDFKKVAFFKDTVEAGAGIMLPALSRKFIQNSWGGFEFMCGIPGTVGGAVRINAGTKQGEIKDQFLYANILGHQGKTKIITKVEMNFSHRYSVLSKTNDIVLSAVFKKKYTSDKQTIIRNIKKIIIDRRQSQPSLKKNCGSVFKNPPNGKPAWWYIENAGLKGTRIGGAMVAYEHANWIVNLGDAKAVNVKSLIQFIQSVVFSEFGITLERELIFIPEDLYGA